MFLLENKKSKKYLFGNLCAWKLFFWDHILLGKYFTRMYYFEKNMLIE